MNIRPIFWLLPALFAAQVQAAPLPPKVEQSLTAPEEHFDKQPPADVPEPPEPPQQSESGSLTISSEELQKQPALLKQAFYSAIAANNTPAVRLLLPLYRRLPDGNEEVPIALSEAMIARADGHYAQAIEKFRFALDKQPDMPVAQMSLAQTLHSDYRYPSAAKAFEEIAQRTDLPPEFHQVAQTYLNSIKAREDWKFQVNGNYLDDKNVGNTPDRYIIGAWSLNPPESAHGISYYGSVSREKWLADHFTLRYGADLYGKTYWDNHRFDDLAVRVKAGFGYQTGRSETVVQPYFERRWFGSDGYSRELGIGIDWSYWLTARNQLMLSAAHATQNYDDRRYLEGRVRHMVVCAQRHAVLDARHGLDAQNRTRRQRCLPPPSRSCRLDAAMAGTVRHIGESVVGETHLRPPEFPVQLHPHRPRTFRRRVALEPQSPMVGHHAAPGVALAANAQQPPVLRRLHQTRCVYPVEQGVLIISSTKKAACTSVSQSVGCFFVCSGD